MVAVVEAAARASQWDRSRLRPQSCQSLPSYGRANQWAAGAQSHGGGVGPSHNNMCGGAQRESLPRGVKLP